MCTTATWCVVSYGGRWCGRQLLFSGRSEAIPREDTRNIPGNPPSPVVKHSRHFEQPKDIFFVGLVGLCCGSSSQTVCGRCGSSRAYYIY